VPQIALEDDHIDGDIKHSAYERLTHVFSASILHLIVLNDIELKKKKNAD